MIQPNYQFVQGNGGTGLAFPQAVAQISGMTAEDEVAFRAWLSRRESARQQIRRLSRRESQVVSLVAQGLANKSIALELEISVKTIEKHRANAARKLGVNSTAELVRLSVLADQDSGTNPERNTNQHSTGSLGPSGTASHKSAHSNLVRN